MKLEIKNYETCINKHGFTDEVFSGTADGIDFIASHSGSEHCGAVWSNGAFSGKGFDVLYEKYGDSFTDAIYEWWNIYSEIVENATYGLEHRANEVYATKEMEVA